MDADDVTNNRLVDRRNASTDGSVLYNILTSMPPAEIAKIINIASHINGNTDEALRLLVLLRHSVR